MAIVNSMQIFLTPSHFMQVYMGLTLPIHTTYVHPISPLVVTLLIPRHGGHHFMHELQAAWEDLEKQQQLPIQSLCMYSTNVCAGPDPRQVDVHWHGSLVALLTVDSTIL